ncbi:hypothetical protein [Novosphingobium huizhouense]|uniref:hypothetical protein n=1 Tax=Novosphingobium huizhouense TaxID=2866625 RepID=UPI001CD8CB10|nr:hypothetical protein [Novosphingobium huizhouense]
MNASDRANPHVSQPPCLPVAPARGIDALQQECRVSDCPDDELVPANPVTRARAMVEAEVPPERRGPGWDRHWRELEAYAAAQTAWALVPATEPAPSPGARKRRRRPRTRD